MPLERQRAGLIDVLDRVLDKGIVIDAWVDVTLLGLDLLTVEARVIVASIDTYLKYSRAIGAIPPQAAGELAQGGRGPASVSLRRGP